ncbi:MAG: hypothetical protein WCK32_02285 [Chlorobiaceae bacterium]
MLTSIEIAIGRANIKGFIGELTDQSKWIHEEVFQERKQVDDYCLGNHRFLIKNGTAFMFLVF